MTLSQNIFFSFFFIILLFCLNNCKSPTVSEEQLHEFSFENDLEMWNIRALDVTQNLPDTILTIPWHIVRSNLIATSGVYSLEFYFQNYTDAAKIWIERQLSVIPNKVYRITLIYDFASADGGIIGKQALVTRITPYRPQSREDIIVGALPEGTYNGGFFNYRWLRKEIQEDIQSNYLGQIFVLIGIWGTFEITSTYYIDNIRIQIVPR
ncbi:hypothetical protein [Stygiobacter electus]|uniref:Uncharacterized protein n=1 Tax=Stygiobacter electus TaxID=3032292 RepID=A0AAE3TDA8_9BACT|nr:hypothetical protein [Stygiobacter electus]MDF1613273.1 hypothetical protein [Stygiobacter electus]